MPFELLKSRCLNLSNPFFYNELIDFTREKNLKIGGFVYETKTNEQGGLIYPQNELESFVSQYQKRPELEEQCSCESITQGIEATIDNFYVFKVQYENPISSIIRENYDLYVLLEDKK